MVCKFTFKNSNKMKYVYEIVKVTGCGVMESPNEYHSIGAIYAEKEKAEQEVDRLWKANITEKDRKSGWCGLHYVVKEREIM